MKYHQAVQCLESRGLSVVEAMRIMNTIQHHHNTLALQFRALRKDAGLGERDAALFLLRFV